MKTLSDAAGAAVAFAADTARPLLLTSPALRGADVLAVQQQLELAGFAPGPVDGVYGPATEAAVRAYQAASDSDEDGVVGPVTRRRMVQRRPVESVAALRRVSSSAGLLALAEARRWVDHHEQPAGSNLTPFGRWFGVDGVPWGAIFVSYCFGVGAGYRLCSGFPGAGVRANGCTYVPTLEAWLRATRMWVGRTAPMPGDLVVFDLNGRGEPEHVGLVESVLGPDRFRSIEGNAAVGDDPSGGAVLRRLRYTQQVGGFGRVTGI